jgi:hypothetical protein
MLLHELVLKAQQILPLLPMMEPILASLWNIAPNFPIQDSWFFNIENQAWGNNAEASSSRGPRGPRLQFIRNTSAPSSTNQNVHVTLAKGRDISMEADGEFHSNDWAVTTEGVSNNPNVHDQLQAFLVTDSGDNSDVIEDDSTVIMP